MQNIVKSLNLFESFKGLNTRHLTGDNVRIFVCVVRNNAEHLCNSNLLLYSVNLNMYK